MKILFFGTPDFAVPSLKILCENGFKPEFVITAPDKPSGRGLKLSPSPIKEFALAQGVVVLQPISLKDPEFQEKLRSVKPDLGVVVAFRKMPESVWAMPKIGSINLHGSLLPNYRGAAPIHHAVINGEMETGLTTFFLRAEIDEGDIIFSESLKIGENETTGELSSRMMVSGASLLLKTVQAIQSGDVQKIPQKSLGNVKFPLAPKLSKEFCKVNWAKSATEIHNFIRGLSPFPGAFSFLAQPGMELNRVGMVRSVLVETESKGTPGEISGVEKGEFMIQCGIGKIKILELKPEGKKAMDTASFLRGARLIPGACFISV